uniref:Reverse transcriptase domain-containing protein n=1 Tax=Monopterus albus TaxID=43700 RepID=A0A3Q3JTA0_MONAL
MALDNKCPVLLVLLDLFAAFDTVDHAILLSRLEHLVGLRGTVLNWFSSFLTDRTFSVSIGDCTSNIAPLISGVPQGSTLAPLLFSLYIAPLAAIIANHNICYSQILQWLYQNFLQLNESKTEYILFRLDSSPDFNLCTSVLYLSGFCHPQWPEIQKTSMWSYLMIVLPISKAATMFVFM